MSPGLFAAGLSRYKNGDLFHLPLGATFLYSRHMETIAVLMIIGVMLLVAEVFLPGGIAGLVGFGCMLVAVILAYSGYGFRTGNALLFGVLAALVIGSMLWLRHFPNSRVAKRFISNRVIGDLGVEKPALLNKTGTAFTDLRPSGTAVIDGERVDVVAESQVITKGTPVKVIQVEGMRVVVRAI
ncbi:MAG: NfeD family protein [Limisphaerales bacterium]